MHSACTNTFSSFYDMFLIVLCTGAGAGAGVLTYFAGAGAGVCSPPAKTPEALICAANYHCTSAKEFMIDNYGILYYFVNHCGVCKTVGRVKHPIKF